MELARTTTCLNIAQIYRRNVVIKNYFKWWKNILTPMKGADHDEARRIIKGGYNSLKKIRENRSPKDFDHDPRKDFKLLMKHWGIEEHEIPRVVKSLMLQAYIFLIFGIYGVFLGFYAFYTMKLYPNLFYSILLMVLGFSIFIMRIWRVYILKNRKFISFRDWMNT